MKTTFWYTVEDGNITYGPYEIESTWGTEHPEWVAEEAAEDFFHNHDGWEHKWPLKISIESGSAYMQNQMHFEVDMESVPSFSATEVWD